MLFSAKTFSEHGLHHHLDTAVTGHAAILEAIAEHARREADRRRKVAEGDDGGELDRGGTGRPA